MKQTDIRRQAFTLIELAIVLVIIGLLVGGMLVGQHLIHAVRLQSVSNEATQHIVAIDTFRKKYMALPGDMPNAVRYWGPLAGALTDGTDADCDAAVVVDGQKTCNGNGNGKIGGDLFLDPDSPERHRSWQHLANAGMVTGSYTGLAAGATLFIAGENAPASKLANGVWSLSWRSPTTLSSVDFAAVWGNYLTVGAAAGPPGLIPGAPGATQGWGGIMTGGDAYNIDIKMDDGKPGHGVVLTSGPWDYHDCAADENNYDLASDATACHLFFLTGH